MKHLILIICTFALLISFCNMTTESETIGLIIGTYTSSGSHGIYSAEFNQETGHLHLLDSISVPNPSYVALSDDNSKIYAVNENGDKSALTMIDYDIDNGKMKFVDSTATVGDNPCYVSLVGNTVFTANYTGGSLNTFKISNDKISLQNAIKFNNACKKDSVRQATSHIHCVAISPDKKNMYATDLGADLIYKFDIINENGDISTQYDSIHLITSGVMPTCSEGIGPRHLIFSDDGQIAYLISELSGTISVFSRDVEGNLNVIETVLADNANARGSADLHLSPDNKFLYASTRIKDDGITIFKVENNGIHLSHVDHVYTGRHPRNFIISPNGKFLLVACRDDNRIEIYKCDTHSGIIEYSGVNLEIPAPVCLKFAISLKEQ